MKKLIAVGIAAVPLFAMAQSSLQIDERVVVGELANGLDYYILPLAAGESRPTVEMRLYVNAGSLDETDEQLGYAHFVEHMAFNGSENYSGNEVVEFFERAGMQFGGDINAYTTFHETVYTLSIPVDDSELVSEGFQVLGDWAYRLDISAEEVEKEVGIIVEEYKLREGTNDSVQKQVMDAYYAGNTWGERRPIGTLQSIQSVTAQGLRDYYETHYQPDRMAVVVAGPIDALLAEQRIKEEFSAFEDVSDIVAAQPKDSMAITNRPWFKFSDANTSGLSLSFFNLADDMPETDQLAKTKGSLTAFIVANAVNTRLAELANDPAAPVSALQFSTTPFFGRFKESNLTAEVKADQLAQAAQLIEQERIRLLEFGLTAEELQQSKAEVTAMYQNAANWLQNAHAQYFAEGLLEDARMGNKQVISIEGQLAILADHEVTEQTALDVLTESLANGGWSLTHPQGVADALEADVVSRWLTQARSEPVEAVQLAQKQVELGQTFAGEVVAATELPLNNAYALTLSNGQQAWVVESAVEAGKAIIQLEISGGALLLADQDLPAAKALPTLMSQQPRLGLTSNQLQSELTTRQIRWDASIGSYGGYVSVEFPISEAEFAQSLIVDLLVNPLPDASRIEADIEAFRQEFDAYTATPSGEYDRAYNQAIWGNTNHAWENYDLVDAQSLARAAELLTNKDNIWLFVGDAAADQIAQFIASGLAGLPVQTLPERASRNLALTEGTETVFKGSSEQGAVTRVFRKGLTIENPIAAELAVKIIDDLLTKEIREKQSLVYGYGVDFFDSSSVFGSDVGFVAWSAEPENTQKVRSALDAAVNNLLEQGLTNELLEQSKKQLKNSRKDYFTSLYSKTNLLANSFMEGELPVGLEALQTDIDSVTAADVEVVLAALFSGPAYQATFQP